MFSILFEGHGYYISLHIIWKYRLRMIHILFSYLSKC